MVQMRETAGSWLHLQDASWIVSWLRGHLFLQYPHTSQRERNQHNPLTFTISHTGQLEAVLQVAIISLISWKFQNQFLKIDSFEC
jgi:hypothetical protein